jgi:hypothetical protein
MTKQKYFITDQNGYVIAECDNIEDVKLVLEENANRELNVINAYGFKVEVNI